MKCILIITVFVISLWGCKEPHTGPKPRAYPRIEFPERSYVAFDTTACRLRFEYPSYADVVSKDQPCWFDLDMKAFNAKLHCSYIPVRNRAEFDDLVRDAFVIADKINERSNYMEQALIGNDHGVNGLMFSWTGPAASPIHFFLTDTTTHFFTAALYYNSAVRPDSLAPITEFIRDDINHIISTFQWKDK